MGFGIKLKVWGDYAAFNRPEMKVERVSYDIITPSAARGILEAIYWKPQMRWVVDKIHVLKPIRFTQVRRNEISEKIPKRNVKQAMKAGEGALGLAVDTHRQQRAAMVLRDVSYGIQAHVEVIENGQGDDGAPLSHPEGKHLEMFKRRVRRGQYFHHPYLGVREFPAHFELLEDFPEGPETLKGDKDLGFMLHDILFVQDKKGKILDSNKGKKLTAQPRFFRAQMRDGVVVVPSLEQTKA